MTHLHRVLAMLLFGLSSYAQETITISGTISDKTNGETLIGVAVYDMNSSSSSVSNTYGFYSLKIPAKATRIYVSGFGFTNDTIRISGDQDVRINIELTPTTQEIGEVVITGTRANDNITNTEISVARLTAAEIQKVPQLLGETDVVRTLTLLPGITTVGEGASGFNVRGGNTDQNLILLDEAPVFNSSHLFGFFSVFNADAVKDVKLFKGGIPSQYGGRLSSVLDVRQKEGNTQNFAGNGGIGLLSSRLTLEGPIIEDKMSFMVAGRRSYLDIFLPLSSDPTIQSTTLYFYDLNAKVNYKINDRQRIYASAYFGRDNLGFSELFNFGWGNVTTTLRWNNILSDELFLNVSTVYSDYTYNIGTPEDQAAFFNLDSRIRNNILNGNLTWFANTHHEVDFGVNLTNYIFDPGKITGIVETELASEYAAEFAGYISDEWSVTENFTILAGLRYSGMINYGPRTVNEYDPNAGILEDSTVIGQTDYASGEIVASYFDLNGLEPRLAMNYTLSESQSIKASYNRTRQYIHLISNTTSATPVDIWRPAGRYIQPATADQVAIGYFQNLFDNQVKISVESYYKWFSNLVDYKDGADLIFEENIEKELLTGHGRAYGLEVMIEKKTGWLTGWISYTLARSERRVQGDLRATRINDGEWYAANFDKPHDLSIVLNAQLSENWEVGANFAYQTGRPVTYPDALSEFQGVYYPVYSNRNGARIPHYHRLDLSATYSFGKAKYWEHSLSFGVYNAYGRKNPYSIYFEQNQDTGKPQAVQLSIFASQIPFVTYNFKF